MHLNPQPTLLQGWCLPMAPTPALHYSAPITSLPAQVLAPSCLSILHSSFFFFNQTPDPHSGPKSSGQLPIPTCSRTRTSSKSSTRSARSGVTVTGMSRLSCKSRRAGVQSTSWLGEGRGTRLRHSVLDTAVWVGSAQGLAQEVLSKWVTARPKDLTAT